MTAAGVQLPLVVGPGGVGFPAGGKRRLPPTAPQIRGGPGPDREVAAVAAHQAAPEAAPGRRPRPTFADDLRVCGAVRKLRSPRHLEVGS
jgi:hypothetical protein